MPTRLVDRAVEDSTYIVVASFYENTPNGKVPIVPNVGLTWKLVDEDGVVVNGRTAVPITPAIEVYIVLKGADLAVSGNHPVRRAVTVVGTYDGFFGNNLPIIDEAVFQIFNLKGRP